MHQVLDPRHMFEATMMLCFFSSWVFSLARSARVRTTGSKSIVFLWVILGGYVAGITHKLVNRPDYVIWLYSLNAAMVTADIALYYRNWRCERAAAAPRAL
jgi:hypothetical protein